MRFATVLVAAVAVWLAAPVPAELTPEAWRLFIIFMATIASVIVGATPIFVAAVGALVLATLTSTLTPAQAFAGFSDSLILLIVVAFLIARAVAKSGLGDRIAYMIIARLGRTTMGLAYSVVVTDLIIAPAFPSNTARSGILFPIVRGLGVGAPDRPRQRGHCLLGFLRGLDLRRPVGAGRRREAPAT